MNKTFNKIITALTLITLILIAILFGIMTININILKNKVQDLENQISIEVKENPVEKTMYRTSKTDDYYIAFTDNDIVDYVYADSTGIYEGSMKRDQFKSMFENETKNYTERTFNGDLCILFIALKDEAQSWTEGRL